MARQVYTIGKVGGNDNVVTIKMLYNAVFLQGYYPAGILVHAIVN